PPPVQRLARPLPGMVPRVRSERHQQEDHAVARDLGVPAMRGVLRCRHARATGRSP
ncbi:unnamed protein product, partial [Prorocentrum cordatum]